MAVCEATAGLLRAVGFRVEAFLSAEGFLKSGHLGNTCCLISDVQLPRMSGLDLQDYLAAAGRRIPIIFITGIDRDGVRERALKAGAVGFLRKPPNPEALLEAVRSALKLA